MIEKLLETLKKENEDMIKKQVLRVNEKVDQFWEEFLGSLQKKKIVLEEENRDLIQLNNEKEEKISSTSNELIKISEGIDKGKKSLVIVERKYEEQIKKLSEVQQRVDQITDREKKVEEKEKDLREKEIEIKARMIQLEEKRKQAKKILAKIGE